MIRPPKPPSPPPAASSSGWETRGSAEKRREGGRSTRGPERERPQRRARRPLEAAAAMVPLETGGEMDAGFSRRRGEVGGRV
jgi:hypothetical protein